ncbi:hypothetical protein V1502_08795 [Bacillus sp. SCS-153A]|uniref:hypothetical protein n=1 Tax=Rossellomorea sedimentorum TaxID=3115294 RepID=UPI003905BDA3
MNKIIIKIAILLLLCCFLFFVIHFAKKDGDSLEKDHVKLMEKYFAPSQSTVATGVKSKKRIQVTEGEFSKCAMEFSNKKIFEVECDRYLDYNIGDNIFITYQNDRLVRIGKK